MATTPPPLTQNYTFTPSRFSFTSHKLLPPHRRPIYHSLPALPLNHHFSTPPWTTAISNSQRAKLTCKAAQVSSVSDEESQSSGGSGELNWVPVVPLAALPRGERRVIIQDGEEILLLWYKDQVFAIENRSPAEGAYTEGLLNAKLTQDGCIVCPSTDSTFDLRTGEVKEWYPKNPVLRALTPSLRTLYIYPIKTDEQNIYISMGGGEKSDALAEIVFSGKAQPGMTASDVNVEEVKMIVDEDGGGFGFTGANELINGKAAAIGFLLLIDFELLTGKGLLKGTGFLDFIYSVSNAFN
ncbi:hypothetical protein HS088_TW22G00758 [Tripterygium wilfordii]|uniref:Rieske domain-containing protein n=1 Tax=Tripterygium wilfordii TaxID=458696 RepID=A0A7J7BYY3_TRIWF|nr:uncharacterized protein LOC119991896 [Tripterygium wilfordii]KAF5727071.1 hypothetical protein HS088_TW22G00758 [Tripterygium wilfordii]